LKNVPAPQMWIGSSLALGFEAVEIQKDPTVIIKAFDWGRADLCTEEDWDELSEAGRALNLKYWRQYCSSVTRLHWELSRIVSNRCSCKAWSALVFELTTKVPDSIITAFVSKNLGYQEKRAKSVCIAFYQFPDDTSPRNSSLILPMDVEGGSGRAFLHVELIMNNNKDGLRGSGEITVVVRGVVGVSGIPEVRENHIVSVRVIAFERDRCARRHVEVWRKRKGKEVTPTGRGCERTTTPGKFLGGNKILWDDRMEFIGWGEAGAADAEVRMAQSMPEVEFQDDNKKYSQSRSGSRKAAKSNSENASAEVAGNLDKRDDGHERRSDSSKPASAANEQMPMRSSSSSSGISIKNVLSVNNGAWPRLLPPEVGQRSRDDTEIIKEYCEAMFPWLYDDAKLPFGWNPDFKEKGGMKKKPPVATPSA